MPPQLQSLAFRVRTRRHYVGKLPLAPRRCEEWSKRYIPPCTTYNLGEHRREADFIFYEQISENGSTFSSITRCKISCVHADSQDTQTGNKNVVLYVIVAIERSSTVISVCCMMSLRKARESNSELSHLEKIVYLRKRAPLHELQQEHHTRHAHTNILRAMARCIIGVLSIDLL